jgi:hypothetical protein
MDVRTDLEWVSVEPISGTVGVQDSSRIGVTFQCSESRVYSGALRVLHNDPCQPAVDIPIDLVCEGGIYRYFLPNNACCLYFDDSP